MMKVLVLGATGMLGHKLMQVLGRQGFDTTGTVRGRAEAYAADPVVGTMTLIGNVQAEDIDSVIGAVATVRPTAVVNCIGIIKQLHAAKDPLPSITVNSLFPHRLAQVCRAAGARLVHISTDCVFSGRKGHYTEDDEPDANDLYGRTKLLGEVSGAGCLTLRTSIIGRELTSRLGLVEWFLSQEGGSVRGYSKAIYTGLTTWSLANVIGDILEQHQELDGLWQVSSEPISKYELLGLVNQAFDLHISIERDEYFVCDRSLDSTRFRMATGYQPLTWLDMIAQMASDPTPYNR